MLYVTSIADVMCLFEYVLNLVYELPEDGTDVPKNVGALKGRTFKCVSSLYI
jgi:hypothetical protein